MHAPARLVVRIGLDPDSLTYASVVISLLSIPLLATGHVLLAAAVIVVGAAFDALDGMVARAIDRASAAGAVLDSFVDRLADAAPYIGLALFYRARAETLLVPIAALVASSLVSYARAKADIYRLDLPNGLMRRHERVVYLVMALLVAPVAPRIWITATSPTRSRSSSSVSSRRLGSSPHSCSSLARALRSPSRARANARRSLRGARTSCSVEPSFRA